MRPALHNTTIITPTSSVHVTHPWKSPIPYLFGGLALMLALMAFALIILACSHKSSSSSSSGGDGDHEKPAKPVQQEMEPRIVVIMAGDDNPTYLAKPAFPTPPTEQV